VTNPELRQEPCQKACRWRPTEQDRSGERLFACTSCGSQWVRSQPWAPIDADGSRHPSLTAELSPRPAPR